MSTRFQPDQIAAVGICIFAVLSIFAFSKKKLFQDDEESSVSIKVQSIYVLAALFGLLLVRNEFAPMWGNMWLSYSMIYLYLSVANIAGIGLYIALGRTHRFYQKLPRDGQIIISQSVRVKSKGKRIAPPPKEKRRKEMKHEENLLQLAHKILNDVK